jgi:sarcosine oxidase
MTTYDVIVIGVGAMGAAACHHLARRGVRVLGLEQFAIPHALGSSHGHTRMIRLAYYEHADYVPLLRRAYQLWDESEADGGQKLLHRTGGVYMGPPDGHVVPGAVAAARLHGLAHETLSRDDLRKRHPHFAVPDSYTAVFEPEAGFVLCEAAVAVAARLAMRAGATIRAHEPVRAVDFSPSHVTVRTDHATHRADRVVFCGGAWSGKLLASLGLPPLVVTRQTLGWVWPRTPDDFRLGRFPVWGVEQPDGSLAYGFPMLDDVPGLKLARHGLGPAADADTVSRTPANADRAEVTDLAARLLPAAADAPLLALRVCLYTNSPDGHFILDRITDPAAERAVVACGFSGHGFKFAPVIGQILADLVTTGATPLPAQFLGLSRFRPNAPPTSR